MVLFCRVNNTKTQLCQVKVSDVTGTDMTPTQVLEALIQLLGPTMADIEAKGIEKVKDLPPAEWKKVREQAKSYRKEIVNQQAADVS